jgi:hypothetical protein
MSIGAFFQTACQFGFEWLHRISKLDDLSLGHNISTQGPLISMALDAAALCAKYEFTPFPYTDVILKIVATSWLQDMCFGTGDEFKKKETPLGGTSSFFAAFQVLTVAQTYFTASKLALSGAFGESAWACYSGWCFFVGESASIISLQLLIVKLYCQTNTNDTGAPPGLGRLNRWKIPGFGYPKAKLFWILLAVWALGSLMPLLTHTLPMVASIIVGLLFVFWSLPCLVLCCTPLHGTAWQLLTFGTTFHAQIWQFLVTILTLTIMGLFARKWLWEIQSRVYNYSYEPIPFEVGETFLCNYEGHMKKKTTGDVHHATITKVLPTEPGSPKSGKNSEYEVTWENGATDDTIKRSTDFMAIRGPEPNGPYGFNTPCYSILFTMPMVVLTSSFVAAAVAVYSGHALSTILMAEYDSRRMGAFDACAAHKDYSTMNKGWTWLKFL